MVNRLTFEFFARYYFWWWVCPVDNFILKRVFTSSTAADKAQVVESGHLALDGGCGVPQLCRIILIISRHNCYQGAVRDFAQSHHLMVQKRREGRRRFSSGIVFDKWLESPAELFSVRVRCRDRARCHRT